MCWKHNPHIPKEPTREPAVTRAVCRLILAIRPRQAAQVPISTATHTEAPSPGQRSPAPGYRARSWSLPEHIDQGTEVRSGPGNPNSPLSGFSAAAALSPLKSPLRGGCLPRHPPLRLVRRLPVEVGCTLTGLHAGAGISQPLTVAAAHIFLAMYPVEWWMVKSAKVSNGRSSCVSSTLAGKYGPAPLARSRPRRGTRICSLTNQDRFDYLLSGFTLSLMIGWHRLPIWHIQWSIR